MHGLINVIYNKQKWKLEDQMINIVGLSQISSNFASEIFLLNFSPKYLVVTVIFKSINLISRN